MTAHNGASLHQWAEKLLEREAAQTRRALDALKKHPNSGKCVHAARKALARFEAAYADLGTLIAKPDGLTSVAPRLHRAAGKIRNADVACKRLERYASKAEGAECDELGLLAQKLRKRRKRATREFFQKCGEAPVSTKVQTRSIDFARSTNATTAIAEILRVRTAEMLHDAPALHHGNDESLHAFRLRCKQLRYALQRFDAGRLGLGRVEEFLGDLVDALGAAHDCSAIKRRAIKHRCSHVAVRAAREGAQHLEDAALVWLGGSRIGGELQALAAYAGFSSAPVRT